MWPFIKSQWQVFIAKLCRASLLSRQSRIISHLSFCWCCCCYINNWPLVLVTSLNPQEHCSLLTSSSFALLQSRLKPSRAVTACFALMKRSSSPLSNAAVGSQKQIPLLPINAAAMQEEGRGRGGSFLFTDWSTCHCMNKIIVRKAGMLL